MDNKISKDEAKKNLKIVLEKYNKFKNSDALKVEANAEKIIEEIFEKVLGWESLEDYIKRKSQDTGKFPDYTFRINGINKFFLEAKKLGADLDNLAFQKQAIGYARSSAVPFAILTNFREIRVYVVDREIDDVKNYEKVQLFKPLLIENCLEDAQFENLWKFSKESFVNRDIYSFAEERCKLPKRKEIGKQLSIKLNDMRQKIKTNIKKHEHKNKIIISDDNKMLIEEVVQKLLDRLVFIRVCEDREYENHYLESYINAFEQNKNFKVLESIKSLFRDYNIKNEKTGVGGYDSGLFEESLCDSIYLEDEFLVKIIKEFYYFEDGTLINFSKIPADILGNLYEDYLSHISRNIETQKSHKKEQGIYYTPTYVVDYIVRNTLGEVLKDKKRDIDKVKILDPACGSGSFLIKAFDFIEEHYKKNKDYNQKTLADDGMTYSTKEKILKNNIFGVDLDAKAVEIAQLNLLLKIAEKGHKLPILQQNIKRGNSIIDDEEIERCAFKWQDNFKEGNFDVVIGNPPYIAYYSRQKKDLSDIERNYYKKKYCFITNKEKTGSFNTIMFFIEKGISVLKEGGLLGLIIDLGIFENAYKDIRKFILTHSKIKIFVKDLEAFEGVGSGQVIIILEKCSDLDSLKTNKIEHKVGLDGKSIFIKQQDWINDPEYRFEYANASSKSLLRRVEQNTVPLGKNFEVICGLEFGALRDLFLSDKKVNEFYHPVINGSSGIPERYSINYCDKSYVLFNKKFEQKLTAEKKNISKTGKDVIFASGKEERFNQPKLFVRQSAMELMSSYDNSGIYGLRSLHTITPTSNYLPLKCLLAIINSKLMTFYALNSGIIRYQKGKQPQIRTKDLEKLPIKNISPSIQQILIQMVDKMLTWNKKLIEIGTKITSESKDLKDKINNLDKEINQEVYKLYGITKEEQDIIEKSLEPTKKE